jgi:hypothetical protein
VTGTSSPEEDRRRTTDDGPDDDRPTKDDATSGSIARAPIVPGRLSFMRSLVSRLVFVMLLAGARSAAAEPSTLTVEVSGDFSLKSTAVDDPTKDDIDKQVSATSDYWLTDQQLREVLAIAAVHHRGAPTAAEKQAIDQRMKGDPRLNVLVMIAGNSAFKVAFMSGQNTKYKDVPFKPGHYPLVPGISFNAKAGQFGATFKVFEKGGAPALFVLDKPGELDLLQFDKKAIKGTFAFTAKEVSGSRTRKIVAKGVFTFQCQGVTHGSTCPP